MYSRITSICTVVLQVHVYFILSPCSKKQFPGTPISENQGTPLKLLYDHSILCKEGKGMNTRKIEKKNKHTQNKTKKNKVISQ